MTNPELGSSLLGLKPAPYPRCTELAYLLLDPVTFPKNIPQCPSLSSLSHSAQGLLQWTPASSSRQWDVPRGAYQVTPPLLGGQGLSKEQGRHWGWAQGPSVGSGHWLWGLPVLLMMGHGKGRAWTVPSSPCNPVSFCWEGAWGPGEIRSLFLLQ